MDVLDLFFKKYSYKFPKGYPDMNNEQDILLLENILNELDIKISFNEMKKPIDFLSDEAKKIAQNVIQNLNISADDIKALSKNKIVILSDERQKIFSELEKLGYKRDSNISGSSQGGFRTDNNIDFRFNK